MSESEIPEYHQTALRLAMLCLGAAEAERNAHAEGDHHTALTAEVRLNALVEALHIVTDELTAYVARQLVARVKQYYAHMVWDWFEANPAKARELWNEIATREVTRRSELERKRTERRAKREGGKR